MRRFLLSIFLISFTLLAGDAWAQMSHFAMGFSADSATSFDAGRPASLPSYSVAAPERQAAAALLAPVALPRMSPELAVRAYELRLSLQAMNLNAYSATTLIQAELPDMAERGEFELRRRYAAPNSLKFTAVRFSGDNFVKSNVITRLLQSEVDHVQKEEAGQTAISTANYKFSYKGTEHVNGRLAHVFQVKPRQKRVGLIKGHIFLDVHTGSLVRVEGSIAKSPSLFIKKVEFVQDYADVGSFTFPVHLHSVVKTRLIGRAVVDVYHRDYQPSAATSVAQVPLPLVPAVSGPSN